MKVFLTGASGFIGKRLMHHLVRQGHDILALSRNAAEDDEMHINWIQGSLEHSEDVIQQARRFSPEVLIHLAWNGIPDFSYNTCRKNLENGLNALDLARKAGCRSIIAAGSCAEYRQPYGLIAEDASLESTHPFSSAKHSLHMMGRAFCNEHNMAYYWTRLFYVYGPGQRNGSLIPHAIESFIQQRSLSLNGPENRLDFIYVDDVAGALETIMVKKPEPGVYNVGTGQAVSVQSVVEKIARCLGQPCPALENAPHSNQKTWFYADRSLLTERTGWEPGTVLDEGIARTVNWFTQKEIR